MAVMPPYEQLTTRRTWRHAVAGALDDLSRRILPQQAARSLPLPESLTHSAQQAAYAAQLQQNVLRQQNAGRRRVPTLTGAQQGTAPDLTASALNAGAFDMQMQMNQAPQATPVDMYAPGAPLPVTPNLPPKSGGPRQFAYPIGYNITPQPRATEATSFAQLRGLAYAYYGIRLCERVYFDVIAGLELKITFAPNIIPDGESEEDPKWLAVTQPAATFLRLPDGNTDLSTWLTASVRDELELGHSFLYKRRNRKGGLIGLDLLDPTTIKPLLDERGRAPKPPYPAFEQYLYGVPAYYLAADEVSWIREMGRSDSVYSLSRVEDILINVNQALQKQALDLARYTDGAVPQGFITTPADSSLTAEQLETMEQVWNGLLAGNSRMRVRAKFLMPGQAFQASNFGANNDPLLDFDRFLLNTTVAAFGLTMDELGMTETSNKSVGQSQQAVVYRRAVRPLVMRRAHLLTTIVREEFDPRLVVTFSGYEEEQDQLVKVQSLNIGVKAGALSPSRMARMMGWPVDLEIPPMLLTKDGPLWLEDALNLRQAQQDARLKGLQFPVDTPTQAPAPTPTPGASTLPTPPPVAPTAPATRIADGCSHADEAVCPADCDCAPTCICRQSMPEDTLLDTSLVSDEYRRWRTVALRAVKVGKPVPTFHTTVIPQDERVALATELRGCVDADAVRATFELARTRKQSAVPVAHGKVAPAVAAKRRPSQGVQHAQQLLTTRALPTLPYPKSRC